MDVHAKPCANYKGPVGYTVLRRVRVAGAHFALRSRSKFELNSQATVGRFFAYHG